jgi:hypothetical protein
MIINRESYDKCLNVGDGGGDHSQCNEYLDTVGYIYLCTENWDLSLLVQCAIKAGLCVPSCLGAYWEPASCADCLVNTQADCCGDECEVCDFVEECYPTVLNEIQDLVFWNFDCLFPP